MPVTTNNVLLRFHSNTSEVVRLSVPRARLTTTTAEAEAAMQAMIATGIIITANGIPASIKGAEIVTTERSLIMQV